MSHQIRHRIICFIGAIASLFCLGEGRAADVNFQVQQNLNLSSVRVGTTIVFTLQYSCISTIADGQNAEITCTMDPLLTVTGLTNSSHVAGSSYAPGNNQVKFQFVNPLPAGSTGEVKIMAEFDAGVTNGYQAQNTATMVSQNGNVADSNTVTVTAVVPTVSGPTYQKGVRVSKTSGSSDLDLPYERVYYDIRHGNTGGVGDDVANYVIEDIFPADLKLNRFTVGRFPGTSNPIDVRYRTNNNATWTVWPSRTFESGNSNSWSYIGALGLPVGTWVTGMRFDYGTVPGGAGFHPDGSGVLPLEIDLDAIDPSALVVGTTLRNCATLRGTDGGTNYNEQSCVDVAVSAPDAKYRLVDWDSTGTGPYVPGDTVRMGITFSEYWDNGIPLVNPTIACLLPPGFTYQANMTIDGDIYTRQGSPVPTVTVIDDFEGTTRQMVRIRWNNLRLDPDGRTNDIWIRFDMLVGADTPYGSVMSEIFGGWDSPLDSAGIWWRVSDDLDYDGDGSRSELVSKDIEWWAIGNPGSGTASIDSRMGVKGELDSSYSRFPNSGLTVPGGQADYRLEIVNTGGVALKDLNLIEILPHIGDRGVIDLSDRNSEWAPFLAGAVAAPAGIVVYYSTAGNPCRNELTPGVPVGCEDPAWSTTPPADMTTVRSLKFAQEPGRWLMPGESMTIEWPMRAPINAPSSGEVAWSSFGVVAARADNSQKMLASEPMKVGIGIQPPQPPFVGDTVWVDENRNGIQDSGEVGLNGVLVELYRDNGDGVADPTVDSKYGFTRTSNDGSSDGKYLFSYLPSGSYFLVFHMPADFSPSPSNRGSDSLDSDGVAGTLGGNLVAITSVTRITDLEVDLTWDQGVYDRSKLPAVWAIAELGGGSVVIGGKFESSHGVVSRNIAVLDPNGRPSGSFRSGAGFDGIVKSLAVTDDGKILVGGEFTNYDGHAANGLALLDRDGSWVSGLAMPNVNDVRWVGASGGSFYVAGGFTSLGGKNSPCIGKLKSNGAVDTSFDPGEGADGPIHCAAIDGNGIVIGGSFTEYLGVKSPKIARINSDGSIDQGFTIGEGFDGPVNSITSKGGMLYAVGEFTSCNGKPVNGAARLSPNGTVDPSFVRSSLSVHANRTSN